MSSLGAWPSTIGVRNARFTHSTNQRVNASPFGGSEQAIDMLNDRWLCSLTLPVNNFDKGAEVEAFLASFRGQVNTVDMWHHARPQPRGTLRGSPTLSALAAQGASALSLTGFTGHNRVLRPSEFDNAYWGKSQVTVTPNAVTAPDGSLTADTLLEVATNAIHSCSRSSSLPVVAGNLYTWSLHVQAAGRDRGFIFMGSNGFGTFPGLAYNLTAGTVSSSSGGITYPLENLGGGWYRVAVSAVATSTVSSTGAGFQFRDAAGAQTYMGDIALGAHLWGAQFEEGALTAYKPATTLLAGDMLGAGGQLLMVSQDADDGGTGAMTVQLVNRLREQIASGAAATWDKPTAPFRMLSHSGVEFGQGLAGEVTLSLGEAIGA